MSNFHFETEFRYIFFKKFLQRRTRPPKFSKLKDALWCLWAIFAKYHIICSLLRIPLDRLAGMPKGAFTALHSTAWAYCLSLRHNEERNGYTGSAVGQSIFISWGFIIFPRGGRIRVDIKGKFSWTKWVNFRGHFS